MCWLSAFQRRNSFKRTVKPFIALALEPRMIGATGALQFRIKLAFTGGLP